MTRKSLFTVLSVAVVLMLLITACGDDDDDDDDATATSPSAGGAPTETRDAGGGATEGEATEGENGGGDEELIAQGMELHSSLGCVACHSVDGSSSIGPTWQGLWGKEETLADGSTVTVDEEYIAESIREPNAKVVEGFQEGLMPTTDVTDEQVDAIVAYIQSIS
jgi:cytochrome c oxidase subunit 2